VTFKAPITATTKTAPMSATPQPPFDREAIQSLVAEVVRRIRSQASPTTTGPQPQAAAGVAAAVSLEDRVVTLAALERLPAGTRRVSLSAAAVVTPSARDHARDAGIELVRGPSTLPAPAVARTFVIAHADSARDAAIRAAAIARNVPGAQQLPASGLADVITAIAGHASRDAARGILLTGRPAVAVVLANRSASLRAVTGRDLKSVVAAAAESAANLLVVDPAAIPSGLERLCREFASAAAVAPPAELAAAPAGCGCKTHPH
jgi:hypothetical protein